MRMKVFPLAAALAGFAFLVLLSGLAIVSAFTACSAALAGVQPTGVPGATQYLSASQFAQIYGDGYPLDWMPQSQRELNTVGRCVHSSTENLLKNLGLYEEARLWEKAYTGGEYSARHTKRLDSAGLVFAVTTSGSVDFLDWACGNPTRPGGPKGAQRGAGITLYGSHVLNLIDMDPAWTANPSAWILNNWTSNYRRETAEHRTRTQLISEWQRRGGWAFTIVSAGDGRGAPAPPRPYIDPNSPYVRY